MVKNNTGGNKSKKQGRKFAAAALEGGGAQQKVRRAEQVGEMYAAITKIFGGTSCKIICIDGTTRDCIIRRKFNSAGGKRQNMLSIGTWVLVGLRDWEVRTNGEQKCDLLEVYSPFEKDRLKQIENNFNFKILNVASDVSTSNNRGANIAEQSTKYEDNCEIVTFANTTLVAEEEEEDVPVKTSANASSSANASTSAAVISSSDATSSSGSSSEEEEEAPSTKNYVPVKKQNDWMIDVDDI
jgi:translation initiation factor IF-1